MLKDNKDENDKTELVQYQSDENDKKTETKTHQSQPRSPQWTRSQQTDIFFDWKMILEKKKYFW